LSRCQIFDFKRIETDDIAQHLASIATREGIQAEPEALELIARKADGGLRDALSLFDLVSTFSGDGRITYSATIDNLHILDYDYYFKITDALLAQDSSRAVLVFNEILRKGFDAHLFVAGLGEHLRNLLMCKDPQTVSLLSVSGKAKERYQLQAQAATSGFLLNALNLMNQCDLAYKNSKHPTLLVELHLFKMAHLPSLIAQKKN
jgi:DNA polymerase-3 subunit gamma/tau